VSVVNSILDFLRFNKKNWKAVVLCLFAATVFWFFNALNKNYAANINFPVAFDYDQENFVPVKALPSSIRMNVSGLGWDLFRKSSGLKVPPLVIPLERPTEVRKIVGSTLPPLFSTQLEGLQINFVLTDTVYVDIDERTKKKFKLAVNSPWQFLHPDFGFIHDIKISPDTVWIEGPRKIINELPEVLNLVLPDKNINSDFIGEVEVSPRNDQLLRRDPPVVQVSFDVEKLMEIQDRLPLQLLNVPEDRKLHVEVTEVNCTYRLPVSLVKSFSSDSLKAVVDLATVTDSSSKIIPSVDGLPKQARLVKIDTVRVNF
jgi:hypothetical protein